MEFAEWLAEQPKTKPPIGRITALRYLINMKAGTAKDLLDLKRSHPAIFYDLLAMAEDAIRREQQ